DLHRSGADVVGSVAHYLAEFGWQRGLPTRFEVAAPVDAHERALMLVPDILPTFTTAEFATHGARLDAAALAFEARGGAAAAVVAATSATSATASAPASGLAAAPGITATAAASTTSGALAFAAAAASTASAPSTAPASAAATATPTPSAGQGAAPASTAAAAPAAMKLALVELQNGEAAPSYVAGSANFYAITRYNWSSYYAMAVIELGEAVALELARTGAIVRR
ncbi:MAG: lytic murein transglycosylase, partial [Burkholderiaceae bacterium]